MSKQIKAIGFHHGQRGDLAINIPAIDWIRKEWGWQIDMAIHRQFADMLPLFANHPAINSCIVTNEYENFPSQKDRDLIFSRGYDTVFNPMQPHRDDRWWVNTHQTSCVLYDYVGHLLKKDQQQIELVRWFEDLSPSGHVTFAPFAGNYNPSNTKALSKNRAQEIVDMIRGKGYGVIQIGGPGEPKLEGAFCESRSYFESVRVILGSRALIHTDTGIGWVTSGYKHLQLGLYSHAYYGEDKISNIQPRNPNSRYLSAPNVNEISLDSIAESLDTLLS